MESPRRGWWLWILLLLWLARPALAQQPPDTAAIVIDRPDNLPEDHSPRGALWRAAAVPGWGQYYNRHYLKIPIAWAGIAGTAYAFLHTNDQYFLYRNAHRFKISDERVERGELEENPYLQYEDEYQQLVDEFGGEIESGALRSQREKYRRYRDLSLIGGVLFYGLTIVDAYVSAHLLHFDVGEDLSIALEPRPAERAAVVRFSF